jgi:hypothetical protein
VDYRLGWQLVLLPSGKGNYPLSSTMILLTHLIEAPSSYGTDDTNAATFVEVTSIIGSHDVVEEFLACGL